MVVFHCYFWFPDSILDDSSLMLGFSNPGKIRRNRAIQHHKTIAMFRMIGGLEHVLCFHSVGNVIIPTDEVHHFSDG